MTVREVARTIRGEGYKPRVWATRSWWDRMSGRKVYEYSTRLDKIDPPEFVGMRRGFSTTVEAWEYLLTLMNIHRTL